ncbi:hypothetical protein Tco_1433204, partial [Tanacetum coccineum]
MAEENVLAPTRTDAQLVPFKARLPIRKINLLMDLQKMQENPIFRILVDLLALGITPKDSAYPFVAPHAGDLVIEFVNNLGYPEELQFVSKIHNIHKRPQSPLHITTNDYSLANLKFVPKGELDKVFAMAIPKDLITDVIRNSEYYQKYLDMAARKPRQATTVTDEEDGKKKKAPPAGKSKKPAPAKQPKPVKKKSTTDQYILQRQTAATQDISTGPSAQPQDDASANVVRDTPSPADAET